MKRHASNYHATCSQKKNRATPLTNRTKQRVCQRCQSKSRATLNQKPTKTMQAPYIPTKDANFALWLANFAALITATPTDYGLVTGDATIIQASADTFAAAYALAINPSTRTSGAIADKDTQRTAATATVQPYAQLISKNMAVSDLLKIGVGVNLPNATRTPVPPPLTAPGLVLVSLAPGVLTLGYHDVSTPLSKAKPFGAVAMELRKAVGTALEPDPDACTFYGLITKAPNSVNFTPAESGKIATLYGRWVTRSGPAGNSQAGPWSAALTFTVS